MPRNLSIQAEDRATQLLERAAELRSGDRLSQAERAVATAHALLKKSGGTADTLVAVHLWQGWLAEARGDFDEARSAFTEAMQRLPRITHRELESRVLLRVEALAGLARAARELGELIASGRSSARALGLVRSRLGKRHAMAGRLLIDLGVLRKAQGRYDEALLAYREALPIVLREDGAHGHEAATLYHNLGGIEHARNNLARAEKWARKSVEVRRALGGKDDVWVALDEAALAAVLEARGKFQEAFELYQHAGAVFRRKRVAREIAYTVANTAALLQRWGRTREAERHYREALPLLRKTLGPQHAQVALTLNNYGVLLSELGRARAGIQRVEQACAIAAATMPPRHPQRQLFAYNLKHLSTPSKE